jgi:hypothetical protein
MYVAVLVLTGADGQLDHVLAVRLNVKMRDAG